MLVKGVTGGTKALKHYLSHCWLKALYPGWSAYESCSNMFLFFVASIMQWNYHSVITIIDDGLHWSDEDHYPWFHIWHKSKMSWKGLIGVQILSYVLCINEIVAVRHMCCIWSTTQKVECNDVIPLGLGVMAHCMGPFIHQIWKYLIYTSEFSCFLLMIIVLYAHANMTLLWSITPPWNIGETCQICNKKMQSFSYNIECSNCLVKYHTKCINENRSEVFLWVMVLSILCSSYFLLQPF